MSYQVLARKWRPQTFKDVVGQPHIAQTLENALTQNRLHHALLFTGLRGTGKTSTARILAKAVRCPNAKNFVPCNECRECEDISLSRSVNVIEIDGASNNGVDAIRELREGVGYMPSSGSKKIYIIDEVHMLTTSAFNALLKTLEEPPAHVLFIMATTEVHKIPATILSRCQRFDFRRIHLKTIVDHLDHMCKEEGVKADSEALWLLARQSEGSMRDAQSLLDQVITFSDKKITVKQVSENLGLSDRTLLKEALGCFAAKDSAQMAQLLTRIYDSGTDPDLFVRDLLLEVRNWMLVHVLKDKDLKSIELPESDIEFLKSLKVNQNEVHWLYDMALKGAQDVSRSPDPQITLDMVLLRMTMLPALDQITVSAPTARPMAAPARTPVAQAKATTAKAFTPPPRQAAPAPQAEAQPDPEPVAPVKTDKWSTLVAQIKTLNTPMGSQLEHTVLMEETPTTLRIGVPLKMKFVYEQAQNEPFRKKMENYVKTYWGQTLQIKFELMQADAAVASTASPKALADQKQAQEQAALREQVENHPLVKMTKSVFKSEIQTIKSNASRGE